MNVALDEKILLARVQDAIRHTEQKSSDKYLGFLDQHMRRSVQSLLNGLRFENYCFFGGYEEAERVFVGFFPDYEKPYTKNFPISSAKISWKFGELNHRDFLGSILSLGIERDKIGDIIFSEQHCFVFAESAMCNLILQTLTKVGGTGVSCEISDGSNVFKNQEYKEIRSTIASNRLDCVVAAICNKSRNESENMIFSGKVSVDFRQTENNSQKINMRSTISIRQHGRFEIMGIDSLNKKGKHILLVNKYL
jgi:RNA-binding protein YlmH